MQLPTFPEFHNIPYMDQTWLSQQHRQQTSTDKVLNNLYLSLDGGNVSVGVLSDLSTRTTYRAGVWPEYF